MTEVEKLQAEIKKITENSAKKLDETKLKATNDNKALQEQINKYESEKKVEKEKIEKEKLQDEEAKKSTIEKLNDLTKKVNDSETAQKKQEQEYNANLETIKFNNKLEKITTANKLNEYNSSLFIKTLSDEDKSLDDKDIVKKVVQFKKEVGLVDKEGDIDDDIPTEGAITQKKINDKEKKTMNDIDSQEIIQTETTKTKESE